MTLEQFAALGEILGSVAVVASLIYVAKQLRQNTDMMRVNASSQRVQRDFELNHRVSDSQEFAEIWLKGNEDFKSLNEAKKIRLIFFARSAIVHWHNMFQLRAQGMLPDSDWNELIWLIQHIGIRQDIIETWGIFKNSFDKSFQEFLEGILEKAKPLT